MRRRLFTPVLALTVALALWAPHAPPVLADEFPDVDRIESDLVRGASTKQDVRRLLGLPDGIGSAMFPPAHQRHRVWFYEDIEVTGMTSEVDATRLGIRMDILVVFFLGDVFDGFSWASSGVPGETY